MRDTKSTSLILYGGIENTAVIAGKGIVIASIGLGKSVDKRKIDELLGFSENKYKIRPSKIYLSGRLIKKNIEFFDIQHYQVKQKKLSPISQIQSESHIKGKDSDVLSLKTMGLGEP